MENLILRQRQIEEEKEREIREIEEGREVRLSILRTILREEKRQEGRHDELSGKGFR